jgi:tetratricopeptide (TPR) repeat protein/DNA-binding SARP family transcriptional activator
VVVCADAGTNRFLADVMVEFRLLGAVEVVAAGRVIPVGPPQRCGVLAALATDAGRLVTGEVLVDRVWGEQPPVGARRALHAHITRIRRLLEQIGAFGQDSVQVVHRSGGYLLEVDPGRVDLHRFLTLVGQARAADCADGSRVVLLREALGLWRGEPLAGVSGRWAGRMRDGWCQQHLDAVVAWGHAELRVGNPTVVIGPLIEMVGEHPLVEPLVVVLMRALYATGHSVRALEQYVATRHRLVAELGAEPAAELRDVHQAILRDDLPPLDSTAATTRNGTVPAQLPPDVFGFTGRDKELRQLDAVLATIGAQSTAVVISAVAGTAGVGKTTLAVHWAHRVSSGYSDGQLYIDLRGYDPDPPVTPADALAVLLRGLGVDGAMLPAELTNRASLYRSLTAGRRLLIVLDNANSVEQVRMLLPGTASCLVLITSRDDLAGLVARDGARRIDLDLLPMQDAVALLGKLIGTRVDAEPDAATLLAERCGRLPLALRIAAELAVTRQAAGIAELVAELADEHRRLDVLAVPADERTDISSVLSWSYRQLASPAARCFRLLGLSGIHDIDSYAAAALTNADLDDAGRLLNVLGRGHLLQYSHTDHYWMHDLLRAYTARLAHRIDSDSDRNAALSRMFDYYVHTAAVAMNVAFPSARHRRPPLPAPHTPSPPLPGRAQALAWLDQQLPNLVTVTAHTARYGWPDHAHNLAATLWLYLIAAGRYPEAMSVHRHALDVARAQADRTREAAALNNLGRICDEWGRYEESLTYQEQALGIYAELGDQAGLATASSSLGALYGRRGRQAEGFSYQQRALDIFRELGDRFGESIALTKLGNLCGHTGDYRQALTYYQQTLAIQGDTGDRWVRTGTLIDIGIIQVRLGLYDDAITSYRQALDSACHDENPSAEARARLDLAGIYHRRGLHDQAVDHQQRALNIARRLRNDVYEAFVLNLISIVHQNAGRYDEATNVLRHVLTTAVAAGDINLEVLTLNNLGTLSRRTNHPDEAITHHQRALDLLLSTSRRADQAETLNNLATALHAAGHLNDSLTHHKSALKIATELEEPYEQARALHGIGDVQHASNRHTDAIRHWHAALHIYTALDVTETARLRDHLERLNTVGPSRN